MGCLVVAEFLLTIASRGHSAIAELLVKIVAIHHRGFSNFRIFYCPSGWEG